MMDLLKSPLKVVISEFKEIMTNKCKTLNISQNTEIGHFSGDKGLFFSPFSFSPQKLFLSKKANNVQGIP